LTNAKRVFRKTRGHRAYLDSAAVAQTSKSAVSWVSKPANALPTWKSAIRQVWKPALRAGASGRLVAGAKSALRAATQKWVLPKEMPEGVAGFSCFQGCLNAHDLQYWLAVETQGSPAVA
jgi:hypothetical protein